jgi:predicted DNA-binding protein YlxM (UPF0122 family)
MTDPITTEGARMVLEPIICTYLDIDRLIRACQFEETELWILRHLMKGYSMGDIAGRCNVSREAIRKCFIRMVDRIVECNKEQWSEVYEKKEVNENEES